MNQGSDQKKALGRIALQQRAAGNRPTQRGSDDDPPDLDALKALSDQFGVPGIDLSQVCVRITDLELLPREIAERHAILPVLVRDDRVFVAMVSPGDKHIIDELEFVTGKKVFPYVALPNELQRAMAAAYDQKNRGEAFYIGPRCPLDTLRRMGALPPEEEEADPLSIADTSSVGPEVVLDDAAGRAAERSDLNDGEFVQISEDVSVVTDLPGPHPGAAGPSSESQPQTGRTILVVDDEPDIRKMLVRLLKDRNYRVVEADRGLQALRIVKEQVPDIIILDAMLPEVHGFEIARRIKGSQKYGHIPIIMISAVYRGWRYAEDVKSSYGVDVYIEKPFRIADILKAIDEVASKQAKQVPEQAASGDASSEAEKALAAGVAAYQAGDIDGAIVHLKRGIGIDPLAYRMHFHLALLCGKKGLLYEAIQHLERALDINPRHFPAMKNLAVLYQKAGFRNKAIETWERAIAVAPDEATRQSIKELLLGLL